MLAGASTQYTVTVTNNGPDGVSAASVIDNAPAGLSFTGWSCAVTGAGSGSGVVTACGTPAGAGNINTTVTLQPGAVVTYQVVAAVDAAASGSLTNTASVAAPAGVFDANSANDSASDTDTVNAIADLAVTVDDGVTGVLPGSTTAYTVTVINNGPASSAGAILTDPATAGLAKMTVNCGGVPGQCVTPPTVAELESGGFVLPALAPGGRYELKVIALVTAPGGSSVTNSASVALAIDPVPGNNSASDTDAVIVAPLFADLAITVTNGASTATPGALVTYVITATNLGPNAVTGATVSDTFPPELGGVSWTCVALGGTCPPGGFGDIAASVDLPVGTSVLFSVIGTLNPASVGVLANTASIAAPAGVTDPAPGNNSATDADPILPAAIAADLGVTVDDGVASLAAGGNTTYIITVTNFGSATVTGAILGDPVAPGLVKTAIACAAAPGQCVTPPTIVELDSGAFALPALAPGATYALAVTAAVTATAGAVANTVTVAMPGAAIDAAPANNSATDVDTVAASLPGTVDVSVDVDNGVTTVTAGSAVTYTITVSNAGPANAVAAAVNDAFPVALGGVTWNCVAFLGGVCPEAPGTGDIATTVNVPAGASVVFTATGTLSPAASGSLVDTATVLASPSAVDTNAGNDSATDSDAIVPVVAQTDLAVSIDDGTATVTAGTTTTYTVTVINNGPSSVAGAILADPDVAGLAKRAVACAAVPGQCVTPPTVAELESGAFTLPALASGQRYALAVTADVTASSGSVTGMAAVVVPAGVLDTVPANDDASDVDAVIAPPAAPVIADVAVAASANPGTVSPGGSVIYTLTVTNNGPAAVVNAVVNDLAPAGVTFGNWSCSVASAGAGGGVTTACGAASGSGNVNATATLQPGAVLTYAIAATVASGASGNPVDVATVNVASGETDPSPGNNTASATIQVQAAPVTPVAPVAAVVQPIPTMSESALIALALLMFGVAALRMRAGVRGK